MKDIDHKNKIVQNILSSYDALGAINHIDGTNLPSHESISDIITHLKDLLFPGFFGKSLLYSHHLEDHVLQKVAIIEKALFTEINKSLRTLSASEAASKKAISDKARDLTTAFLEEIPGFREQLKKDAKAIFDGDPAALSESEVIIAYPGFLTVTIYRMAHFLYQQNIPLIPRIMTEIAHRDTGIDIHPGAVIGAYFCIDHGSGIVIGESTVIGDHVKLYQGVTLGALSVRKSKKHKKRHPTIEDKVTIYAGTTILGGDTVIGKGSTIGGNVWITDSIPENSTIYLSSDREQIAIKRKSNDA